MLFKTKHVFLFISIIFLISCASKGMNNNKNVMPQKSKTEVSVKKEKPDKVPDTQTQMRAEGENVEPIKTGDLAPEYGKRLLKSKKVVEISKENDKFDVNLVFDAADIYEVAKTIFTEVIKSNFIIDPSVKGTITLSINGKYSENDILRIFSRALDLSNLSLIRKDGTYVITTKNNVKEEISSIYDAGLYAIEIIQLQNMDANYVAKNLATFASKGSVLTSIPANNSILIFDKKENIENIANLISIIDSNVFKGIHFEIIPVENILASEASALLNEILSSGEVITKPGVATDTYIRDLKSNNSLLVLSRNKEIFNYVKAWLSQIDKKNKADESGVYVYYVENGNATELAKILSSLFDESGSSDTAKGNVIVEGKSESQNNSAQSAGKGNFISANLKGGVKIIPDENNNAIVIKANPEDYKTIQKVIKQVDVRPQQVLIDVMIAEVTYNESLKYGVQWYLENHGIKLDNVEYSGVGMLNEGQTLPQDTGLGESNIMGFAYGLYNPAGNLRFLLSAIEDKSDINILSSPNILAIDNQEATIEVGQQVPTITQSVTNTNSDGTVTNSVQYRDTGILLEVTPHINSKNLVRLEVMQEVSEAQSNTVSGIDSPLFLTRRANTTLIVKNQETVIIGGLIQEKKDNTRSGIPFLSKIPVLGYLFGGTSKNNSKTELLIAITPKVVNDDNSAQKLSRDFIMRLNEVERILKEKNHKAFGYGDIGDKK